MSRVRGASAGFTGYRAPLIIESPEELVRLAAKPIAYIGCTVIFLGLLYLGMNLRDGARAGGGELRKAIAMIAAGAAVTGFAAIYGFTGF